jgi:transcriptional regulator of acetoin/glycerol metabolism
VIRLGDTHKDLRALVAEGTVREDLYFRVGRPVVALPALRNRPEEIPALIAAELARRPPPPAAHVSLVEQCLLRPWPGNVRELITEIRTAAEAAADDGDRVMAHHLPAAAGTMLGSAMPEPGTPSVPPEPAGDRPHRRMPQVDDGWRRRIEDGLRANSGNAD